MSAATQAAAQATLMSASFYDIEAQEEEDGEVVAYPVDELRPPSSSDT
jgi:hypothetical protein